MTVSQSQARPNVATLVKGLMRGHAEWAGADTPVREVARKTRDKAIGCPSVGEREIASDGFASLQHPVAEKVSTA